MVAVSEHIRGCIETKFYVGPAFGGTAVKNVWFSSVHGSRVETPVLPFQSLQCGPYRVMFTGLTLHLFGLLLPPASVTSQPACRAGPLRGACVPPAQEQGRQCRCPRAAHGFLWLGSTKPPTAQERVRRQPAPSEGTDLEPIRLFPGRASAVPYVSSYI